MAPTIHPNSFFRRTLGLTASQSVIACSIIKPTLPVLALVLPLTVVAVLYLLLQDTDYRSTVLKTLAALNVVAYLPFLMTTKFRPIALFFFVVANPAFYLLLTDFMDGSKLANKTEITNVLLGIAATLSVLMIMPRYLAYRLFECMDCYGKGCAD